MNQIVIAPFSNSDIRDWPRASYIGLIGEILHRWSADGIVRLIGTRSQAVRARDIVRGFDPARVINSCGRLPWPEVVGHIRQAACVVGNNSGVTHLSAISSVPTVCVFGGSHQRLEWRPIGPNVALVSRVIACSPCHLDHNAACDYDKACLRHIAARDVADAVFATMARSGDSARRNRVRSEYGESNGGARQATDARFAFARKGTAS